MNFRLLICKIGGGYKGKLSLKFPFRSKQQLSVPAHSNSILYIKAIHLQSLEWWIYYLWLWQLPRTLTLLLIPPFIPVYLWLPFQAISYPLITELGSPDFDPQCSLKDLLCTDSPAPLMPRLVRKMPLGSKTEYLPICRDTQKRHQDPLGNFPRTSLRFYYYCISCYLNTLSFNFLYVKKIHNSQNSWGQMPFGRQNFSDFKR